MLLELRCTRCSAPLSAPTGSPVVCRYCGASFLVQQEPAPADRKETRVVSLDRVAPSNRARLAALLVRRAALPEAEVESSVARGPGDLVDWEDGVRADALHRELVESGAGATVRTRVVEIPRPNILPTAAVLLDAVGPNKHRVEMLIHEHSGLSLAESKSLVERAPCVAVEALEGGRATAFRDALVGAGATVRTR